MHQNQGLLTMAEAAAYRRVHAQTVRHGARTGAIPSAKFGNRGGFRFARADFDRFLVERRTRS